jgi:spore germination cell wall hydrolase CwlJ-like protein
LRQEDRLTFEYLGDFRAMSLTIYGEARGEKWEGKLAVGFVIVNRMRLWKKSTFDVVYAPNQFSCFLSTDPQYKKLLAMATEIMKGGTVDWKECDTAAKTAIYGWQESTIGDATFYRVIGTKNKWFDSAVKKGTLIKVCEIGHHEFHKEAI